MAAAEPIVIREITAFGARLPRADSFAERLATAPGIHLLGAGRSGLVLRTFAMRLVQLGLPAQVAGDTCAVAARPGERLLVASRSGQTASVLAIAARGKSVGLEVVALCGTEESPLMRLADNAILLPGAGEAQSPAGQFAGSLFEQMLFCFLEETVLHLKRALDPEGARLAARHANLE
jgi:6-phospho-3-hexuloisomerase